MASCVSQFGRFEIEWLAVFHSPVCLEIGSMAVLLRGFGHKCQGRSGAQERSGVVTGPASMAFSRAQWCGDRACEHGIFRSAVVR